MRGGGGGEAWQECSDSSFSPRRKKKKCVGYLHNIRHLSHFVWKRMMMGGSSEGGFYEAHL